MVIICASLPTIRPLITRVFPNFLSSNTSRGTRPENTPIASQSMHRESMRRARSMSIPLFDMDMPQRTLTKVEASKRRTKDLEKGQAESENGEILITTSVMHEVESKSENGRGSEDFIFPTSSKDHVNKSFGN
jgi:hypothetical protein